jgi:hypothetical protein
MKKIFLFKVFQSKYCALVFISGLILGFLIVPKKIFNGFYVILGVIYIILFALVLMCIVRTIKERIYNVKQTGVTTISLVASALGLGALQACSIGAPVCGATIGVGIASIFFPQSAFIILEDYAIYVVILSLILQLIAIYYMGCFKKCIRKV